MHQNPQESMGNDGLTPRQRRFAEEYVIDFRPKAAAIRAGYAEGDAAHTAWRLMRHPRIAALILDERQRLHDRLRLSADRVLYEHARIALADMGRLVRFTRKGPRLRPGGTFGPNETAAVREIIRSKDGFQLRLYDKGRSLDMLTKMFGIVERYRARATVNAADREEDEKYRVKFYALVSAMRERLKIDPAVSHFEAVAHGVARDDDEAKSLAKSGGYIK